MRSIGSNGNLGKLFSVVFAALLIAGSARAGEVVDVRVGLHPRYTRVVLQTSGEVEHSIRRSDRAELRVRVDASSQRRVLASGSGHLRSVSLEPQPDGSTIAVLSLRDSGVSYSEMSLSGPARLVIDLKRSAVAQAAPVRAAEPEPTRASPPVEIEPDTDRAPTDTALRDSLRDHRRTGALDSMGRDFGETEATAGAERLGELADDASGAMSDTAGMLGDAGSDALAEASDAVDAFNTTSSFREILEAADPDSEAAAAGALADGASEEIELAQNATGESPSSYGAADAPSYGSGAAGFDRRAEPTSAAEPRKGFTGFLPAAIDHPLILGGVGVVLLLLLIVLILRGQRRSDGFDTDSPFSNDEPFSLDASEVSEAVDGTIPAADVDHDGQTQPDIPMGGDPDDDLPAVVGSAGGPPPLLRQDDPAPSPEFGVPGDAPAPAFGAPDDTPAPAFGAPDDTPAPAFGAPDDTPAPAFGAPEADDTPAPVAAFEDDSAAPSSPFDASPGDAAPPAFAGANAAQSEELFADERLAHLERKLKDLEEAKDRIERQLAAQSEELRVQRAAIARTQRVLRTVARTDEEATEPVPKV